MMPPVVEVAWGAVASVGMAWAAVQAIKLEKARKEADDGDPDA